MKKAAKKSSTVKIVSRKNSKEKIVIPPDVLGDNISNEIPEATSSVSPEQSVEKLVSEAPIPEVIKPENDDADDKVLDPTDEKPSFYEKVTGKKSPQKGIPDVDPNAPLEFENITQEEKLPQIEKSNKKLFFLGGAVFLLTILITNIVGLIIINTSNSSKEQLVEEKTQLEEVGSPTPVVEIDKSAWTFEVLNGSGEAGKAKKTADAIESMGYTIDNTGNADQKDHTGITVKFVKEIETEIKEVILRDLKKEFLTVTEDDDVTETTDASILIIVGK
ncbi:MAG: LytR C-terminal domain-containing protein [Candidatus Levybacteria bacterium]|nr:LytR C-terminal domain-containing protein [Candidatus Levybacteria bacterium]